jgi:hypothetical protein
VTRRGEEPMDEDMSPYKGIVCDNFDSCFTQITVKKNVKIVNKRKTLKKRESRAEKLFF